MRNILIYFSIKYKGDYKKMYQAIYNKEKVDELEIEKTKMWHLGPVALYEDFSARRDSQQEVRSNDAIQNFQEVKINLGTDFTDFTDKLHFFRYKTD